MREKTAITGATKRRVRADILYQVVMKDILMIFGYSEESKEAQMIRDLINNKPLKEEAQV
jgi:hypothetical protein